MSKQSPSPAGSIAQGWYRAFRWAGAYAPLLQLFCLILIIEGVSRAGLVLWQWDRVADTGIFPVIFLQGLRVDVIQAGLIITLPLLLLPFFGHGKSWTLWKRLTLTWWIIAVAILLFMELATPTFIAQYDVRPNRLFIEYLKYPREVFATLWHGFRLQLIFGVTACIVLTIALTRLLRPWLAETRVPRYRNTLLVWPLVVLAVFAGVRSTTEHRPANPAMFALTSDALVNSLILNSAWSVEYAIYNLKHEANAGDAYGQMDNQTILDEVRGVPWLADASFSSEQFPTLHHQVATRKRDKPMNLVIVLEESLGATFVESLGGTPVTPNLERLKNDGWWFEHLYATGTRSVRGIEAVISSYLPTPARSVVKLSLSQNHFFTIGELLRRKGYDTGFIYGGEAHFDNMRSFFTGNGFEHIVDELDYESPEFTGSWGVSDEDLFNKTQKELEKLNAEGKPFFRLVFSSSNHSPFEFPEGRISLYDEPYNSVNNAVKYADYALGQFIDKARESDYWDNTLFLIVADHDARVYGQDLVPIKNFQIPGLILGPDIEPKKVETIASQIDLAPTMLSLMGLDNDNPMIGRDLTRELPGAPGRAMMQFSNYYAWMEGDFDVTVLRQDQPPLSGTYMPDKARTQFRDTPPAEDVRKRALAHSLLPLWLYREQKYDLP
ncbi:LTA synthase family protein [Marinobacter sp. BGYM27]|uniref:LTA synthase family protein n=1 Tax=Marinobacter sp. BGYM27 TaxID=2975597 RepID=UPI0021A5A207|nr:LTA synthase family protein [Marinobacter sp. BGYM27]MDG5500933.1 LTA synthase family protein [Marinobacter sp. BGYM27]